MTAAVICLAVALAIGISGVVALTLVIRGFIDRVTAADERARIATEAQLTQESSMREAEGQRDDAIKKGAVAQDAADKAIAQLKDTEQQLVAAKAELVKRVGKDLVTGTPQQAIDIVNNLLAGGS